MSYCRWSEGDVYAYDSVEGGVRFCVAHGRRNLDRLCKTYNEAYQYARVLRDTHGLDVPDFAIEALKADAIEEAVRICGPNSAVSELEAENAKLRELAEKAWKAAERLCQAFDGPCRDDGVTIYKPCPMGERDEECVYGLLQRDLRELGVEVD